MNSEEMGVRGRRRLILNDSVGSVTLSPNFAATVTRFRSQKTDALFAYLALYRDRPHTREELITLLWPDADPEAARVNLRSAL